MPATWTHCCAGWRVAMPTRLLRSTTTPGHGSTGWLLAYYATPVDRPGDLVADSAIAADERRRVAECLDSLTDVQRQSIELAYYGGLTYAEVSQRLSANPSTIKSRMRDALQG